MFVRAFLNIGTPILLLSVWKNYDSYRKEQVLLLLKCFTHKTLGFITGCEIR